MVAILLISTNAFFPFMICLAFSTCQPLHCNVAILLNLNGKQMAVYDAFEIEQGFMFEVNLCGL